MEDDEEADLLVHQIASDWRQAALTAVDKSLCHYSEKLTLRPHEVGDEDIETLRRNGLDDAGIHDATQVIGYFNYINRIADALDVEKETFVKAWEQAPTRVSD